jgi:hypothetical protein
VTCPKADEALITAHAQGKTDLLPVWLLEPELAGRLHVSLLELWWLQDHGYSDRLVQYQRAWALQAEHAPTRQARAQREATLQGEGWQGGPTDPLADCVPKNSPAVLRLIRGVA